VASREERATSFGAIADDYDRLRSGPPEAAVQWLLPRRCEVAVDLGAGTGLLSRALTPWAAHVVAVEPDARMAAVLRARSAGVRVVQSMAEAIPVTGASADGVFISSAWHWIDPGPAIGEIARVLRDGGRFGVIWTGRDHHVGWLRDLNRHRELSQACDGDSDRGSEPPAARPGGEDGAPRRPWRRAATLPAGGMFGNVETATFGFSRMMTAGDFIGMLATYSGVITASQEDRTAALATAREMLDQRFPGASQIDVPMRTWCWRADRVAR
jgi:SAM-dependent methyltransferase